MICGVIWLPQAIGKRPHREVARGTGGDRTAHNLTTRTRAQSRLAALARSQFIRVHCVGTPMTLERALLDGFLLFICSGRAFQLPSVGLGYVWNANVGLTAPSSAYAESQKLKLCNYIPSTEDCQLEPLSCARSLS